MQMLSGLLLTGLLVILTLQATLTGQSAARQPLATVDGVAIARTMSTSWSDSVLWPLEDRVYRIQQQAIEALIKQRLLETEAARRKISLQALIDAEVTARAGSVTDEEIDRAKASMGQSSREEIRKALLKEKVGAALSRFVRTLERKSKVRVFLEPPRVPRSILEGKQSPAKGPDSAPVTIVEFTDFHCSHCRDAEAVVRQVLSRYAVRLVHRDLPIDAIHPHAREAHEAARCAEAQGKFWSYRRPSLRRDTQEWSRSENARPVGQPGYCRLRCLRGFRKGSCPRSTPTSPTRNVSESRPRLRSS